jgi:hypothetical protein
MEKITPTKGKVHAFKREHSENYTINCVLYNHDGTDEPAGTIDIAKIYRNDGESNASLYVDAHNTFNSYPMLPSQLLSKLQSRGLEIEKLANENEKLRHALMCYYWYHCVTPEGNPVLSHDNELEGEKQVRLKIEETLKNLSI